MKVGRKEEIKKIVKSKGRKKQTEGVVKDSAFRIHWKKVDYTAGAPH
jgi:hypothetical protein